MALPLTSAERYRIDPCAVGNLVAWIDDNLVTGAQAIEHFNLEAITAADLDIAQPRPASVDDERLPGTAALKQRPGRRSQRIRIFPSHDPRLDAITVREGGALFDRIDKIGDNIYALLLDPERRNLCERRRLA